MPEDTKRRHHHVWQAYLQPWATNGAIWCRHDHRVFSTGTAAVAVERDFYKIQSLSDQDALLLKTLVPEHLLFSDRYNDLIQIFLDRHTSTFTDLEKRSLEQWSSNLLENYHADTEASAIAFLNRARTGDITFYDKAGTALSFLHYLAAQWTRTKAAREGAVTRCKETDGVDLSRIWNVLAPHFALTSGIELFKRRRQMRLTILHNKHTDHPFMTGDQPVINLRATPGVLPGKNDLELYYPITPYRALLLYGIDDPPQIAAEDLSYEHVVTLNRKVHEARHQQVFGPTKESVLKQ